ncbi:c-type cytochrome [Dongia sp.]|uniref:c-type cytochrome n=1 Tax=Dongia sp. TaxID=1977262 RepID=UPI0037535F67
MKNPTLVAAGVVAAVLVAIGGWQLAERVSPADPINAETVVRGQKVYVANCASCHGDRLQGQPNWKEQTAEGVLPAPPHDATGHTWHHPDQQLFKITKLGVAALAANYKTNMVGFGDRLPDQEIWDVIAYIKSTWPPDIQERQRATTKSAAEQGLGPSGAQ